MIRHRLANLPLPATATEIHVNGQLVAVITITDEIMHAAEVWAERIQRSDSRAGFKESFAGRNRAQELAGVLGHLAAGEYMFADWQKALRSIEAGPDEPDFIYKERTLDVKTAGGDHDRFILVPVAKFQKRKHDVYIGAQLKESRKVWIWGYATREEVAAAPVRDFGLAPAHYIPLRNLNPISGLIRSDPSLLKFMTYTFSVENLPTRDD